MIAAHRDAQTRPDELGPVACARSRASPPGRSPPRSHHHSHDHGDDPRKAALGGARCSPSPSWSSRRWRGGSCTASRSSPTPATCWPTPEPWRSRSWPSGSRPARARSCARTAYRRAETLAALANGIALGLTALWVIFEAIARWREPAPSHGHPDAGWSPRAAWWSTSFRARCLGARGTAQHQHPGGARACRCRRLGLGCGHRGRAAWSWGSAWDRADTVASLAHLGPHPVGRVSAVTETVSVLMESVPSGVVARRDSSETIRATPGVADMHDLHAWTISDGFDAVTVHVVLDGTAHGTDVARDVGERIRHSHNVTHVTVQPEAPPLSSLLHPPRSLARPPKGVPIEGEPFLEVGGREGAAPSAAQVAVVPSEFDRYFEPFLGGGALFFDCLPEAGLLERRQPTSSSTVTSRCAARRRAHRSARSSTITTPSTTTRSVTPIRARSPSSRGRRARSS